MVKRFRCGTEFNVLLGVVVVCLTSQKSRSLAGASSTLAPHADSVINVILNGAGRVVSNGVPDSYRMPPFRATRSDVA